MTLSSVQYRPQTWLYRLFKFCASLKLAIFILSLLMVSLAVGTFLESRHGTDAARLLVYQAPWFQALLFLLGMNVTAATIDRLPWKKKHVGFVITHFGIMLILIGSWVSQRFMIDGQMVLAEGETESYITLPEPLLYIFDEDQKRDWLIPLKKRPFPWEGRKALEVPGGGEALKNLQLTAYYPKARLHESIVEVKDDRAAPALKVILRNSFLNQAHWLIRNDATLGTLHLGPATLRFTDALLEAKDEMVPEGGYLEFQFQDKTVRIPINESLSVPAVFELRGTPYQVKVIQVFRNAGIVEGNLVERKGPEALNPAVKLLLTGRGLEEQHIVFANYPDFPTQHGMKPSAAGVRIYYRLPGKGAPEKTHELRFVQKDETAQLLYQILDGSEVVTGEVVLGEEVPTGWMDLAFRVEAYYAHARKVRHFTPEPNTAQGEEIFPAIRLEFSDGAHAQSVWLGQGLREIVAWGGKRYHLIYGQRRIPAGFRLTLRDFRVKHYPGTTQPASFESDVALVDHSRGVKREVTISMNKPLVYRGYRIYQSGYDQTPGQPETSIFSVGRDPGVPINYAGAIVLITGIVMMFFTRKFSVNAGRLNDA